MRNILAFVVCLFPLIIFAEVEPQDKPGPQDNPAGGAIKIQDKKMDIKTDEAGEFSESDMDDPEISKDASAPITDVDPTKLELAPRDMVTRQDLMIGSIAGTLLGYGVGHAIQKRYYDGFGYAYTISEGVGYVLLAAGFGDCGFTDSDCDNKKEGLITAGAILYIGARLAEIFDVWYYYASNKDAVAQKKGDKTSLKSRDKGLKFGLAPSSDGVSLMMGLTF